MSEDQKWTLWGNRPADSGPHAYIQWKGTDVCMDFYCPCGEQGHFDGYFANVVECPYCHRRWEMSWYVEARESQPGGWHHDSAKMLEA